MCGNRFSRNMRAECGEEQSLTHDSSTWLTLARERQCDSCLTHCSSACLTSQRESPHTNLTFSPAFYVFGLAWIHMHTFVFAVMVAGPHVRFVLGVFVCGCVCTAESLRLSPPCSRYRRSLFKGKALYFPVNWPIRVTGTVWQLCFSAEECHSGKTNNPVYIFFLKQRFYRGSEVFWVQSWGLMHLESDNPVIFFPGKLLLIF